LRRLLALAATLAIPLSLLAAPANLPMLTPAPDGVEFVQKKGKWKGKGKARGKKKGGGDSCNCARKCSQKPFGCMMKCMRNCKPN
jgi:hypothetical protein